jgi:hypothetical protein
MMYEAFAAFFEYSSAKDVKRCMKTGHRSTLGLELRLESCCV